MGRLDVTGSGGRGARSWGLLSVLLTIGRLVDMNCRCKVRKSQIKKKKMWKGRNDVLSVPQRVLFWLLLTQVFTQQGHWLW